MPIYQASFEEFKDPFALIQNLNKRGYSKFGCVKVRPPIGWNFEFSFNPKNKKLTTRKQIIKCLSEGKVFKNVKNKLYPFFSHLKKIPMLTL